MICLLISHIIIRTIHGQPIYLLQKRLLRSKRFEITSFPELKLFLEASIRPNHGSFPAYIRKGVQICNFQLFHEEGDDESGAARDSKGAVN